MKRNIKNIIIILLVIAVGICSYFTMKEAKKSTQNQGNGIGMSQQQGGPENDKSGNPPSMPDSNSNNNQEKMNEPPAKPNESSNSTSSNTPPAKPNEENNSIDSENSQSQTNTPPSKPDGDENSNSQNIPPEMTKGEQNTKIDTIYYVVFAIEGLVISVLVIYLIMSKLNKLTINETFSTPNRMILYVILILIITVISVFGQSYITKNIIKQGSSNNESFSQNMPNMMNNSSTSVTKTGATTVDSTTQTLTDNYTTSTSDESVVLVENGGNATIEGATITKEGGDSSNTENSEFYGVNAGVLVTENSTATIKNANISTNAKGSNAVFSTGTDSKIYISNSTIKTTGSGSARGLDATYGGYIEADTVNITTQGGSCATLATDRGEGTVIAKNSNLETNGTGSPVIYSTGNISVENTKGTANGSQMVVIEGKNSATVTDSTLTASATGNRGETDQAGIMIYQSMSGDAGEGTGTFTAKNSSLSIQENSKYYKTAPMFFITNTDAIINLNNCKLSYGSNLLISSKGTSEWGKSGSNGGNLTLNAENQILEGNIEIDNISSLNMNLKSSSAYTGTINSANTAKEINVKIDSSSKITLTGDSYVTSLDDEDTSYSNINFNGYKLYVNGTAIN